MLWMCYFITTKRNFILTDNSTQYYAGSINYIKRCIIIITLHECQRWQVRDIVVIIIYAQEMWVNLFLVSIDTCLQDVVKLSANNCFVVLRTLMHLADVYSKKLIFYKEQLLRKLILRLQHNLRSTGRSFEYYSFVLYGIITEALKFRNKDTVLHSEKSFLEETSFFYF